jgi:hypothetical protein
MACTRESSGRANEALTLAAAFLLSVFEWLVVAIAAPVAVKVSAAAAAVGSASPARRRLGFADALDDLCRALYARWRASYERADTG